VAVAALLLLVMVIGRDRAAAVRLRRGKFGSRLLIKLAGIFALVGLLPGLLIYTVSYQFVSRSIEAWFDVRWPARWTPACRWAAARSTLTTDLAPRPRLAADAWPTSARPVAAPGVPLALERLREQIGARPSGAGRPPARCC
jgi:hypothetical protein